jgi:hypothetical protein
MSLSRIELIAAYIAKMQTASTRQIAAAIGVDAETVGGSLKHQHVRARWGIKHLGADPNSKTRGRAATLWGIDTRKYMMLRTAEVVEFLDEPAPVAKKPKRPKAATPKVVKEIRLPAEYRPVYRGPSLTRWQPSSPYYKEKANEHTNVETSTTAV